MKIATIALVVRFEDKAPALVDIVSDDGEIRLLEEAVKNRESDPLAPIIQKRSLQQTEDAEFGDYVEELLSQPFVRPEIQEHGLQWLKSKIRIEQYQRTEAQAAKIIAEYALKVISQDRSKKDFLLAGPSSMVRIRVFEVLRAGRDSSAA